MSANCPCKLTQEKLDSHHWVDKDQKCTALYKLYGEVKTCGELYSSHPSEVAAGEPVAKRSKLSTEPLSEQMSLVTKGQFVRVKQKILAGFFSDEFLLYVRDETVDLWNALNDPGGHNLSINGPPGTGKSTEAWAWALWKAKNDNVTITWFHLTKKQLVKVVINGSTNKITTGFIAKIKDIDDHIDNSEGSILIVDGVIANWSTIINSGCCSWHRSESGRRFILVSSASSSNDALQEDIEANIVSFSVPSWTFKQYQDACENEEFYEQVKDNLRCPGFETINDKSQLLLTKYYFAGDSARWMFEFTYKQWKTDFDNHLEKVSNFTVLFEGRSGDKTVDAVNHLRGMTVNRNTNQKAYFFISKYVVEKLAEKCDNMIQFLGDSYKKASDTQNPAYEGWIYEFDIDYQLRQACRLETKFRWRFPDSNTDEERSVDEYIVFNSVEALRDNINSLPKGKILWAKPKLWCQKAYDFLCIWKDDAPGNHLNMVVINATCADTHSVQFDEVKILSGRLGELKCVVDAIRFDFMVPPNIATDFKYGAITGRLCGWKNLQGDPWPNKTTWQEYRNSNCLTVIAVARTSSNL